MLYQTALWGWPSKMWQRVSMVKIIGICVTSDSAKPAQRLDSNLNELSFLSRDLINQRRGLDLAQLAAEIAETPCSLIKYESPKSMTMALLHNRAIDH